MAIRGFVEIISRRFVSGWCVDEETEEPVEIEVRIEGLSLGTVRADLFRHDIAKSIALLRIPRDRGLRPLAGFLFPISPTLFRLFPHGGHVQVMTGSGEALPTLKEGPLSALFGYPGSLALVLECRRVLLRFFRGEHSPGRDSHIDNPSGPRNIQELAEKLQSGYIVNPKYGELILPIKERNREEQIFRALKMSNEIFEVHFSKKLFICYGTLLGCIRNDDFIPHDDDVDVCFLADGQGLAAAVHEFRQVMRTLSDFGHRIVFDSNAQFHWLVQDTWLDVFMAWFEGDNLYMYNAGGVFSRSQIYPLLEHEFKGRQVLIPNESEALLELIYGPRWRIPDPSFQWRESEEVHAKMDELKDVPLDDASRRNEIRDYWAHFYEAAHTTLPSAFAASVAVELTDPQYIVDLGCGNGRDSFFFAGLGHRVVGLDFSSTAIEDNRRRAEEKDVGDVDFRHVDISAANALVDILNGIEETAIQEGDARRARIVIYARFFFHAISEEEEELVLAALSQVLRPGAKCFFEFRTEKDAAGDKRFGSHYRRFINMDRFVEKVTIGRPFECFYRVEGHGMARYFEEDPIVGRVFLRRN